MLVQFLKTCQISQEKTCYLHEVHDLDTELATLLLQQELVKEILVPKETPKGKKVVSKKVEEPQNEHSSQS